MNIVVREPFATWSSAWTMPMVSAFVDGVVAVQSWQRGRRTIRLARENGDQAEVIVRMRAVIGRPHRTGAG
jgi:hypothetical protein